MILFRYLLHPPQSEDQYLSQDHFEYLWVWHLLKTQIVMLTETLVALRPQFAVEFLVKVCKKRWIWYTFDKY